MPVGRTRRVLGAAVLLALCTAATVVATASAQQPRPNPVLPGDWPDPSVLRVDGEYWATSTSEEWAPVFRLLRSTDLQNWQLAGAVFRNPPAWTDGSLWAPELVRLGSGFAVFYSALPKDSQLTLTMRRRRADGGPRWYCLGVATAPRPEGPYRDRGRLHCDRNGSIDPSLARDENSRLHLIWKEDGNAFGKPTRIFAQPLSESGTRLLGRPRVLLADESGWERKVVEAPTVIRRDDAFYLIYSASLCCTRRCSYAVGVARSPTLIGRYRKYEGNPILRDGAGWRCPGHPSVLDAGDGAFDVFFHSYRDGQFLVGRQVLLDRLQFREDGWPAIGTGVPPEPAADEPTPPAAVQPPGFDDGVRTGAFGDDFARGLAPEWEWAAYPSPRVETTGPGLTLQAARRAGERIDGAVLSRRVSAPHYDSAVLVDRARLSRGAFAGVAAYYNRYEVIGLAVSRDRLVIWQRRQGTARRLRVLKAPRSRRVYLRMRQRGRRFDFEVSPNLRTWRTLVRSAPSPIEDSARFALTAGGAKRARARFLGAVLVPR